MIRGFLLTVVALLVFMAAAVVLHRLLSRFGFDDYPEVSMLLVALVFVGGALGYIALGGWW